MPLTQTSGKKTEIGLDPKFKTVSYLVNKSVKQKYEWGCEVADT